MKIRKSLILSILFALLFTATAFAYNIVEFNPQYYPNPIKGKPISSGSIYVGEPDLDPTILANQKQLSVRQESGTVVDVSQPITTSAGGVPQYNGSTVTLLVSGDYSLSIIDSSGSQVYYMPSNVESSESEISLGIKYGCDLPEALAGMGTVDQTTLKVDCECEIENGTVETITDNISVVHINGGKFTGTATLNTPMPTAGSYEIYDSALTVNLSLGDYANPYWFGMSVINTASNNEDSFERMIDAITATQPIKIPAGDYNVEDILTVSKACTIEADGVVFDWPSDTAANRGIEITTSDVNIFGIELDGPQFASVVSTQAGIYAHGVDNGAAVAPDWITDIKITDTKIYNFYRGIHSVFVDRFDFSKNTIYDCFHGGINNLSPKNGKVSENIIYDIIGDTSAYGIQHTKNTGDATRFPFPENCIISKNIVDNIPIWTGIDSHGGKSLVTTGNIVTNCQIGIVTTRYSAGGLEAGPVDCVISNNSVVNETISTTDVANGIQLVGATTDFGSNNVVSGNTVRGYGDSDVALSGPFSSSILIQAMTASKVIGNTLYDSGTIGIKVLSPGNNVDINSNSIYGITNAAGVAIHVDVNASGGGIGTGLISNNTIYAPGKTAFYFEEASGYTLASNHIESASTEYDQTGGTVANQYIETILTIATGSSSWDPASIAAGASETFVISAVPGCSSVATATISFNRDLQGMVLTSVCGDTDTNLGTITLRLYNNTAGAIDVGSLSLKYKVSKY